MLREQWTCLTSPPPPPPQHCCAFQKIKKYAFQIDEKNMHINCPNVSGVLSFGGTNLAQSEMVIDGIFTFAFLRELYAMTCSSVFFSMPVADGASNGSGERSMFKCFAIVGSA